MANLSGAHERVTAALAPPDLSTEVRNALGNRAADLVMVGEALESDRLNRSPDAVALAQEAAALVARPLEADVLLLPGRKESPMAWRITSDEVVTVLVHDSTAYSIFSAPYLSLLAHEISHAEDTVHRYCNKPAAHYRRCGEVMADVCALALVGGAFTKAFPPFHAAISLPEDEDGPEHPALQTRARFLRDLAAGFWTGDYVTAVLAPLRDVAYDAARNPGLESFCEAELSAFVPVPRSFKIEQGLIYRNKSGRTTDSPRVRLAAEALP